MRKIVCLTVILFFSLLGIYSVKSYTNALIENRATITITDPANGLVTFVPVHDTAVRIKPGESKAALYVANNLDTPISYALEYDHDYLSLNGPNYDLLYPRENAIIMLSTIGDCPLGDTFLNVALLADFTGGSCRIETDLAVCVEEPKAQLSLGQPDMVIDPAETAPNTPGSSPDAYSVESGAAVDPAPGSAPGSGTDGSVKEAAQ